MSRKAREPVSEFGKLIQCHRLKKELTQEELAKQAGLNVLTVSSWETTNRIPRIEKSGEKIQELANALEIKAEELFTAIGKDRSKLKKESPPDPQICFAFKGDDSQSADSKLAVN